MNYYPHHIGDFRSGTFNMTRLERWIYRDMLEVYYDTEAPLPPSLDVLCKGMGVRSDEEKAIVADLLAYKFALTDGGYIHLRCDKEILMYHSKANVARANGKKGGRKPKSNPKEPDGLPVGTDPLDLASPSQASAAPIATGSQTNQEPRTNNQNQNNPVAPPTLSGEGARAATAVELSIAMRKQGVNCQPADPRLIALSGQGVTVDTATDACQEAKKSKPGQQVIALGYVVKILERWSEEASAINVTGAVQPARTSPNGYESAKDRARRTTIEGLTGHRTNEQAPEFIDINPLA